MSPMILITCLYVKSIAAELFSPATDLQKNSSQCFRHFTERVNKLCKDTVAFVFHIRYHLKNS